MKTMFAFVLGLTLVCGSPSALAAKKQPAKRAAAAKTAPAEHSSLTPEQSSKLKGWQAALDDKSAAEFSWPKEMCGMAAGLPVKLDASIATTFMESGNEANFYCGEVRDKISTICRNAKDIMKYGNKADNKALVNKLITKITCKGVKEPEDAATFTISGGELTATLGGKASNISEKLLEYLYKNHGFNTGELN